MKRIGRHPHIVEFLGCVSSDRPICLILEFVPYGDLLTLLRKLRNERVSLDQHSIFSNRLFSLIIVNYYTLL